MDLPDGSSPTLQPLHHTRSRPVSYPFKSQCTGFNCHGTPQRILGIVDWWWDCSRFLLIEQHLQDSLEKWNKYKSSESICPETTNVFARLCPQAEPPKAERRQKNTKCDRMTYKLWGEIWVNAQGTIKSVTATCWGWLHYICFFQTSSNKTFIVPPAIVDFDCATCAQPNDLF